MKIILFYLRRDKRKKREWQSGGPVRDKKKSFVLSMDSITFNLFTKKLFTNVTLKLKTIMDEFSKYICGAKEFVA